MYWIGSRTADDCMQPTSTIGSTYAKVFPLPVGADTHRSSGGSYGRYNDLDGIFDSSIGTTAVCTIQFILK